MLNLAKRLGSDEKKNQLIYLEDVDYSGFRRVMNKAEAWLDEAEESGENRCIFFYYTGHGFQHNWTFATLNDPTNYKYNMESKLDALSKFKNCCVVAIFDCCREDISSLEKSLGAPNDDSIPCLGSKLFLFGC